MDEQPAEGGCVSTEMEQTEETASRAVLFSEVNERIADLCGDRSETGLRLTAPGKR
jgi:hypothetical protein